MLIKGIYLLMAWVLGLYQVIMEHWNHKMMVKNAWRLNASQNKPNFPVSHLSIFLIVNEANAALLISINAHAILVFA